MTTNIEENKDPPVEKIRDTALKGVDDKMKYRTKEMTSGLCECKGFVTVMGRRRIQRLKSEKKMPPTTTLVGRSTA